MGKQRQLKCESYARWVIAALTRATCLRLPTTSHFQSIGFQSRDRHWTRANRNRLFDVLNRHSIFTHVHSTSAVMYFVGVETPERCNREIQICLMAARRLLGLTSS